MHNKEHGGAALIVFQGLATGSLLYIVFFEILEKERKKNVPGVLQVSTRYFVLIKRQTLEL